MTNVVKVPKTILAQKADRNRTKEIWHKQKMNAETSASKLAIAKTLYDEGHNCRLNFDTLIRKPKVEEIGKELNCSFNVPNRMIKYGYSSLASRDYIPLMSAQRMQTKLLANAPMRLTAISNTAQVGEATITMQVKEFFSPSDKITVLDCKGKRAWRSIFLSNGKNSMITPSLLEHDLHYLLMKMRKFKYCEYVGGKVVFAPHLKIVYPDGTIERCLLINIRTCVEVTTKLDDKSLQKSSDRRSIKAAAIFFVLKAEEAQQMVKGEPPLDKERKAMTPIERFQYIKPRFPGALDCMGVSVPGETTSSKRVLMTPHWVFAEIASWHRPYLPNWNNIAHLENLQVSMSFMFKVSDHAHNDIANNLRSIIKTEKLKHAFSLNVDEPQSIEVIRVMVCDYLHCAEAPKCLLNKKLQNYIKSSFKGTLYRFSPSWRKFLSISDPDDSKKVFHDTQFENCRRILVDYFKN